MNASTVVPVNPCALLKPFTTRMTPPEEWADYYKANVEFFDDLGSPGGAAKIGNTGKDHPFISALPPQNQDH